MTNQLSLYILVIVCVFECCYSSAAVQQEEPIKYMILGEQQSSSSTLKEFRVCIGEGRGNIHDLIVDQSNVNQYDKLNHQWNLRLQKVYPLAYYVPRSTNDVEDAVKCGSLVGIPLTPKSGSHSYESYSFGTNDSIIVDFREMDAIVIDQNDQTVRIQPGALLGPIYFKLYMNGGFTLPMGNCLSLGFGGHTLGGGYGYWSHLYGLTLDHVLELTMVDASGMTRTVNKTHNPDLFWALRGIGSGYIGIVTSFKLKLIKITHAKITAAMIPYPLNDARKVLKVWDEWLEWRDQNDPTVMSAFFVNGMDTKSTPVGKLAPITPGISIIALHIQDELKQPRNNETFVQGFQTIWPQHQSTDAKKGFLKEVSFLETVMFTSYIPVIRANYSERPTRQAEIMNLKYETSLPRYFKAKSFYVNKKMNGNDFERIGHVLENIPDRHVYVMFASESGAIHDVSPSSTAYVHRRATYSIAVNYQGPDDETQVSEGMEWIKKFMKAIESLDSGETYQNFVDGDLKTNRVYLERYYGSNLKKLISVKRKWDANNYFWGPASIPVTVD